MTSQQGPRLAANQTELILFKGPNHLEGNGLDLELADRFFYFGDKSPAYEYTIRVAGEEAGTCTVLIQSDFTKVAEFGNFGMELKRKFYGKGIPSEAIRATYPVFLMHDQKSIMITHDEDNRAVEKISEDLGGVH